MTNLSLSLMMGQRVSTPGSGVAYSGPGDVKSGFFAWWSVTRGYSAAYASPGNNPAMDLVDQAGANQVTINVKSTGLTDTAAITAWVVANSVTTIRVKKLYDQSGGGFHLTQATVANMPKLQLSPALGNAFYAMNFVTALSQSMTSAATGLSASTGTFSSFSMRSALPDTFMGILQAGSHGIGYYSQPSQLMMLTGSFAHTFENDFAFQPIQWVYNGASSFAYVNGINNSLAPAVSGTALGSPFALGKINGGFPPTGDICEVGYHNTVWSAGDCALVDANQNAFYFNGVTAYEGLVASRARPLTSSLDATNLWAMVRSAHVASQNLSAIRVVFQNRTITTQVSNNATITASVEYPAGTFTQITFGGSASGAVPGSGASSLNFLFADYATVSIPAGATFWIRSLYNNAGGLFYNSWQNTFLGEAAILSPTSLTDQTMSGTITNSNAISLPPIAILGVTSNPSVTIFGNSITLGTGDTEDSSASATGYDAKIGIVARSMGSVPFVNIGLGGGTITTNGPQYPFLISKASHIISEYSTNDFFVSSQTSAQVIAGIQAVAKYRRQGQKLWQTTCTPQTTGSWSTLPAQSTKAGESNRVTFNTALRAGGISGIDNYADVCTALESSLNSGLWVVTPSPPYTGDGVHPNVAGYAKVQAAAVYPTISWP